MRWPISRTGLLVPVLSLLVSCGPTDPRAKILEQRGRWQVELLSWTSAADGSLTLSTRVSGPVHSDLKRLTCRVTMRDAAGAALAADWTTVDLSGIQRGTPTDYLLRLGRPPVDTASIDSLSIDLALNPTPEEEAFIEELRR